MKRTQNKNLFPNFFYTPVFCIILLCIFIYGLFSVLDVAKKRKEARINKEKALAELSSIEARKDVLEEELNLFKTEEGVERIIREKYRVVKEGEGMVIILDEKIDTKNESKTSLPFRFWQFILGVF